MDSKQFILKNKPLPKATEPIIEKMTASGQHILFVIVGDLSLKGKYSETALIFTETDVTTFDVSVGEAKTIPYSDMKEVQSKRMYGNATLSAIMPNGKREIFFRYTYAVAALCDAAALFISHINEGAEMNEEIAVMTVTFERALSVCRNADVPFCTPAPSALCAARK